MHRARAVKSSVALSSGDVLWRCFLLSATHRSNRSVACTSGNENPIPNGLLSLNPPQFDYGINEVRACLLEFDPETDTVTLRFIRPNGEDAYFVEMTYGQ